MDTPISPTASWPDSLVSSPPRLSIDALEALASEPGSVKFLFHTLPRLGENSWGGLGSGYHMLVTCSCSEVTGPALWLHYRLSTTFGSFRAFDAGMVYLAAVGAPLRGCLSVRSTREAPAKHPRSTREAPAKHPRSTREAPAKHRHLVQVRIWSIL